MLRFGLGSIYFNDRAFEQAIAHLKSCIQQDPTYTAAYKLLGKAQFKTGAHEDARQTFGTGLSLAQESGDKQTENEITVFLGKLNKGNT